MMRKTILIGLAVLGCWEAAARPLVQTSSGATLVEILEKRSGNLSSLTVDLSPKAEVFTPSDPEFAKATIRWSYWSPPTFDVAFIPATERDISIAVSTAVNLNYAHIC